MTIEDHFDVSSDASVNEELIKYAVRNIISGKMVWLEASDGVDRDRADYIIEQVLLSVDYHLIDDFLISSRLFIDCKPLLDKLILKLAMLIDDMNNEHGAIKIRLFALMQRWLCAYCKEDLNPLKEYYATRLESLMQTTENESDKKLVSTLLRKINGKEMAASLCDKSETGSIKSEASFGRRIKDFFSTKPKTSTGNTFVSNHRQESLASLDSIMSVYSGAEFLLSNNTESLCECLWFIEKEVLCGVEWRELIDFPIKSSKPFGTVLLAIDHFNNACKWIVNCVLEEYQNTHLAIKKLLKMANLCAKKYKNFNSTVQIMLALQNPSVELLLQECQLSEREHSVYQELLELTSPVNSFINIRTQQEQSAQLIPFFGLYLSDLVLYEHLIQQNGKSEDWSGYQHIGRLIRSLIDIQESAKDYHHCPVNPKQELTQLIMERIKEQSRSEDGDI